MRRNVVVNLAPGVLIAGSRLKDVDGRVYELDPAGASLCRAFAKPAHVETVINGFTDTTGGPPGLIEKHVWEFIADLSSRGLLSINSPFCAERWKGLAELPRQLPSALATSVLLPSRAQRPLRRYPGTARGLMRAEVEAHETTAWIGVALVVAAVALAFFTSPTEVGRTVGVRSAALLMSGYFMLLLLNVIIHESAHLFAARFAGCAVYGVYCRSGSMGISFSTQSEVCRLAVAASGPLVALAADFVVIGAIIAGPSGFWAAAGIDQLRLSVLAGVAALAIFQLMCLTPLTKDGRRIASAINAMIRKGHARA